MLWPHTLVGLVYIPCHVCHVLVRHKVESEGGQVVICVVGQCEPHAERVFVDLWIASWVCLVEIVTCSPRVNWFQCVIAQRVQFPARAVGTVALVSIDTVLPPGNRVPSCRAICGVFATHGVIFKLTHSACG